MSGARAWRLGAPLPFQFLAQQFDLEPLVFGFGLGGFGGGEVGGEAGETAHLTANMSVLLRQADRFCCVTAAAFYRRRVLAIADRVTE